MWKGALGKRWRHSQKHLFFAVAVAAGCGSGGGVVVVVVVAATDHRRQCSCANLARGANSRGSQQAPFLKRKGCPTD